MTGAAGAEELAWQLPEDVARVLADGQRICLVPAPTFHERARGELVTELLRQAGGDPHLDQAGNVICRFGGPGPAIAFAAHLDTVFGPEQDLTLSHGGGRISGPGLGDNSLAVAALVHLARILSRQPPQTPVLLAATVGEEGLGDLAGAKHLVATEPCSALVAVEGQSLDVIDHAGIGSIRLAVTITGPGGHSWGDRGTPSAVHGLVTRSAQLLEWAEHQRSVLGERDLVVNLGVIEGGRSVNSIADRASVQIDLRSAHAGVLERAETEARQRLEHPPTGLVATVETVGRRPSGGISADHPLMVAARLARARAGLAPALEGASSTDANAAYGRGIPAITVGVTTGGHAHRADEYIDVAPLAGGLRSLEELLEELSGH